jgi:ComEC/Rec2-related protein
MTRFEYSLAAFCLGALVGPSIEAPLGRGLAAAAGFGLAACGHGIAGLPAAGRAAFVTAAGLAATAGLLLARPAPPETPVSLTGAWVRVEGRLGRHFGPGDFQPEIARTRLDDVRILSPSLAQECPQIGSVILISPRQALTREGEGRRVVAEGYLRRRRGHSELRSHEVRSRPSSLLDPRDFAAAMRLALARRLSLGLSERGLDLARALLLGRPPKDRRLMKLARHAGAAHLLVVSGLHLGILAFILRRSLPSGLSIVILCGYALLSGGGPPVLRALAALGYLWGAAGLGRRPRSGRALLLAAALSLALAPGLARSPAFLLSFGAVAGILAFGIAPWRPRIEAPPSLEDALRHASSSRLLAGIRSGLLVGIGASLGASPTALVVFGTLSPWAPLVSLVLAPLVALLIVLAALSALWPRTGFLMEAPCALFIGALEIAGRLPGAQLEVTGFGPWSCALLSLHLVGAACFLARGPSLRRRRRNLGFALTAAAPLVFALSST